MNVNGFLEIAPTLALVCALASVVAMVIYLNRMRFVPGTPPPFVKVKDMKIGETKAIPANRIHRGNEGDFYIYDNLYYEVGGNLAGYAIVHRSDDGYHVVVENKSNLPHAYMGGGSTMYFDPQIISLATELVGVKSIFELANSD